MNDKELQLFLALWNRKHRRSFHADARLSLTFQREKVAIWRRYIEKRG